MKKINLVITILLLITSGIFASNNSENSLEIASSEVYFQVIDSLGREVIINSEPLRIISLAPSITEIIYSLNAQEKLVGRTDYCDYPAEVSNIPSVGSLYQPNIEKIIELNPDVIIASTHFQSEILAKLTEVSIPVVVINDDASIHGVYNNIINIGDLLNRKDNAEVLVSKIKNDIHNVSTIVSGLNKPSIYYVVGYGEYGDYTAGGDTFISALLEVAGGNNIAKDSIGWSYSLEKIVENNPDIVICSKYKNTEESLKLAAGYMDLPAIKNGNLYSIDNNLIDRQGPRVAEGVKALAKILHPEVF